MATVAPEWPYLVQLGGALTLQPAGAAASEQPAGEYCGEWGSYLDERGRPGGVRIMLFFDYVSRDSDFFRASNADEDGRDLVVLFHHSQLLDTEGMPFLPVYLATRSDGRKISQLSGYE